MAKTKINFKNCPVKIDNGDILITKLDEETGEVIEDVVLQDVLDMLLYETENANLNVSIKEYKEPKPKEPKPKFSYSCRCGNEFVLNNGDLNIRCEDCGELFFCEEK